MGRALGRRSLTALTLYFTGKCLQVLALWAWLTVDQGEPPEARGPLFPGRFQERVTTPQPHLPSCWLWLFRRRVSLDLSGMTLPSPALQGAQHKAFQTALLARKTVDLIQEHVGGALGRGRGEVWVCEI